MQSVILKLAGKIPEGRFKNWLRTTILRYRIAAPRELMVNAGDTVVQVGMWRPASAKRLSNAVGPNGTILFVEVSEDAIKTLRDAVAGTRCSDIKFVNRGAWSSKGELKLILDADPASTRLDTGLLHPGHGKTHEKTVPVDSIDNMCREAGITKIDYIEITVNGAELEALRGMQDVLKSTQRLWIAGLTRDPDTGEPLNRSIADHLRGLGFSAMISHSGRKMNSQWGRLDGHVYGWQNTSVDV